MCTAALLAVVAVLGPVPRARVGASVMLLPVLACQQTLRAKQDDGNAKVVVYMRNSGGPHDNKWVPLEMLACEKEFEESAE